VHGFRTTARILLAEVLEVDPLVIEAQLARAAKNGKRQLITLLTAAVQSDV
jgi:hypothetical protein